MKHVDQAGRVNYTRVPFAQCRLGGLIVDPMDHAPACKLRDREVGRDGAYDLDLPDLLLSLDEGVVQVGGRGWRCPCLALSEGE